MTLKINCNGEISGQAHVSALDHGFLFGDSIYEVLCTWNNQPCFVDRHLRRLRHSAEGLALTIPWTDARFKDEILRTVLSGGFKESYIRIIVTRGEGEIDIDPSSCLRPNVLIYVAASHGYPAAFYEKGINVALVSVKRNAVEALNPGIKTGNYLNNVLAKMEAVRLGANDALMLNGMGHLTECTTSNFFMVRDGCLRTPALECGILSGITREIILQLAVEQGIPVEEGKWEAGELDFIDEAFLSGTIRRIMAVTTLNGKPVGAGKPGPVTRRMMELYESYLRRFGV